MAVAAPERHYTPARSPRRTVIAALLGVLALVIGLALVVLVLSGVTLARDASALARVDVKPLGGTIEHLEALGPDGRRIPIAVRDGRLTPLRKLHPGTRLTVLVTVQRPGWIGWALGERHTVRLTLTTPVAAVSQRWMTVPGGSDVRIAFQEPVREVLYRGPRGLRRRTLHPGTRSVSLGAQPPTGTVQVAAAPRSWESVGRSTPVSWFPPSHYPVMATYPSPSSRISPSGAIILTFSKPVSEVLGDRHPRLSPYTPGRWRESDSHTLVFRPSGFGAPLGSQLKMSLPHRVSVTSGSGSGLEATSQVQWTVPSGSMLRLQQLLAEQGYLPLVWQPSGHPIGRTARAQVAAAVEPPPGHFHWRYHNTPHQLKALWAAGEPNTIVRGAVMKLENLNDMTADGIAGATVWRRLMDDGLAHKRLHEGYSYVYVHREVPETATLWHAGHTILSSAANTGISGAETALGTYPVFEHIPEGTMSGTNPDGSHYEDPGIKWISYFNGGDALHNFDRASFGSPQSLGCVELPLEAAAKIWKYTPIGTLVTIEG
ncbi:MAG TPA: L,D-transpeptidase family protein [Solirubrobacteraceae bacterium]|nr:L,D-transpeptidase family protein [Solirubrobacteraceae bacterium]